MKSKKYYTDLINHNKIIKESETLNSNGEINLNLWLSPTEHSSNKMTINELAKMVNDLANTVNGLVKTVNDLNENMNDRFDQIEKRLDEHDVILKEHSEIFARNNLK